MTTTAPAPHCHKVYYGSRALSLTDEGRATLREYRLRLREEELRARGIEVIGWIDVLASMLAGAPAEPEQGHE